MILLTGGAGFIGSAVLWALNSRGRDDIIVVDNLADSQKWRNLVKRSYADYLHRDALREMVNTGSFPWRLDAVVHLGACSATTEKNADFLMENNFHYSRDLCRLALEKGARFINASSAATYGAGENGFSDSPDLVPRLKPLNMYGYSKQLFDLWLLRENLADEVASLKFFNVYGPNEYHKGEMRSVAVKLFEEIGETGTATLFASNSPDFEDGGQKRDFVYVKDCADLICWLLTDGGKINGVRNVGTGSARTFSDLAKAVFNAMEKPVNIRYKPMPEALSRNYQNYTRAGMDWLETSGYKGKFADLESGIRDYVRNYLAKNDRYL